MGSKLIWFLLTGDLWSSLFTHTTFLILETFAVYCHYQYYYNDCHYRGAYGREQFDLCGYTESLW